MNQAYTEIQNTIIMLLEQGTIPWEQPWFGSKGAISFNTGRPYSWLNQMLIQESGEFLTWNQIQLNGGHLRRGSKGKRVYFYRTFEKQERNDKGEIIIKTVPYLRSYTVFNANDCDGIVKRWQPKKQNTNLTPIQQVEDAVNKYLIREHIELRHSNENEAYYSKKFDYINVPPLSNFKESAEDYYGTLLHEVVHSSSAEKRLNRDTSGSFGSVAYAREELVAEIGAAFLLKKFNIDSKRSIEQSAAYIKSWITALRNDSKLIPIAAGKAERAVQFILGEDTANSTEE